MTTIKSFTDIEQSNKLSKILPLESADMYYDDIVDSVTGELFIPNDGSTIKVGKGLGGSIVAWSLSALLGVLPMIRKGKNTANPFIAKTPDNEYYVVYATLTEEIDSSGIYNNPIDACVDMIERLHELKML